MHNQDSVCKSLTSDIAWEGRTFIKVGPVPTNIYDGSKFRFLSYNVSADSKYSGLNLAYTSSNETMNRWNNIINEIKSYKPDIIAFQDMDLFKEFWQPQLMLLGYDSCFTKKTDTRARHEEGVSIAYHRDLFQLFKTDIVKLNDAVIDEKSISVDLRDRCINDDIAIIAFLQPWPKNYLRSALCIVSAMCNDRFNSYLDEDVRSIQVSYLSSRIERANSEFHVPVILGITLNDEVSSPAYHLLRTGRVQLREEAPRKCIKPRVVSLSRGSVKVHWVAPYTTLADPDITAYKIAWRPGGSTSLSFRSMKEIPTGDCIQYTFQYDASGIRRTIPLDEMMIKVNGLTSGIPYEFKVCAVNHIGQGVWSEPSDIIVLSSKKNLMRTPMPDLVNLKSIEEVKVNQESSYMSSNDFDSNKASSINPIKAEFQLSPRNIKGNFDFEAPRGRVLPYSLNPKSGWNPEYNGVENPKIKQFLESDEILRKEALKRSIKEKKDRISEEVVEEIQQPSVDSIESVTELKITSTSTVSLNIQDDSLEEIKFESFSLNPSIAGAGSEKSKIDELSSDLINNHPIPQSSADDNDIDRTFDDDDILLDGRDITKHLGARSIRQKHTLNLRSVYESYSTASEPFFTSSSPETPFKIALRENLLKNNNNSLAYSEFKPIYEVCCLDYIFVSSSLFKVSSVLTLPNVYQLEGFDPREKNLSSDIYFNKPPPKFNDFFSGNMKRLDSSLGNSLVTEGGGSSWDDPKRVIAQSLNMASDLKSILSNKNKTSSFLWSGSWVPNQIANSKKRHNWLPNDKYGSLHLALCVDLFINNENLSVGWDVN